MRESRKSKGEQLCLRVAARVGLGSLVEGAIDDEVAESLEIHRDRYRGCGQRAMAATERRDKN